MRQIALWDAPSVPLDTSEEAAARIVPVAGQLRRRVVKAIVDHGPLTCEEIQGITGLSPDTARPRIWELEGCGVLRKLSETRPTKSGRKAHLYELVEV